MGAASWILRASIELVASISSGYLPLPHGGDGSLRWWCDDGGGDWGVSGSKRSQCKHTGRRARVWRDVASFRQGFSPSAHAPPNPPIRPHV